MFPGFAGAEGVDGGRVNKEAIEFFEAKFFGMQLLQFAGDGDADFDDAGGAIGEDDIHALAELTFVNGTGGGEANGHKTDLGKVKGVEFASKLEVVNVGGADDFERGVGAAADGKRGGLEEADAGIEDSLREIAHVGGGIDPGERGLIEKEIATPAGEGDHGEIGADFFLFVEHAGELANGHAVAHRNGVPAGESFLAMENGAFDGEAVDGIGAVENEEFFAGFLGGDHAVAHGGDVGVKAAANVLDIEDEGIEILELLGRGSAAFAVEAVNREAGFFIGGVGNFFVEQAADAVFWTKESDELNALGLVEQVDGWVALAIGAGVVADEADFEALESLEVFFFEEVDAVEDFGGARNFLARRGGRGQGSGDVGEIEIADGFGRERAEFAAKGDDGAGFVGMIAVGEKNDEGFGKRINPDGGASPAGVPVRADCEMAAAGPGVGRVEIPPEGAADGRFWGRLE